MRGSHNLTASYSDSWRSPDTSAKAKICVLHRLGLAASLITKLGGDALAAQMVEELNSDGVDTAHVKFTEGAPSPFTYIIVDRAGAFSWSV